MLLATSRRNQILLGSRGNDSPAGNEFVFHVSYSDVNEKPHSEKYRIVHDDYSQMILQGRKPLYEIIDALNAIDKRIQEELRNLSKQSQIPQHERCARHNCRHRKAKPSAYRQRKYYEEAREHLRQVVLSRGLHLAGEEKSETIAHENTSNGQQCK